MNFCNHDLTNIKTPVLPDVLQQLLTESSNDKQKTKFLVDSFRNSFPIGYQGDRNIQQTAPNLKITVGTKIDLWNKVMKEVEVGRYAGPYESIPFKNYIQSPIGLVPKDGGRATRLIFHLSYPRAKGKNVTSSSLNANTPRDLCSVTYADFNSAIKLCIKKGDNCKIGKTDVKSAFRNLGIRPEDWMLLVMKAESPINGKTYYFVDKCLPFGASISCAHFQAVSDAIAHVFRFKTGEDTINYLDDYFFADLLKALCDRQIDTFLNLCTSVGLPISLEKTFWSSTQLIFLGLLIDTE